jgi:hypothetical protein
MRTAALRIFERLIPGNLLVLNEHKTEVTGWILEFFRAPEGLVTRLRLVGCRN